MIRGTTPTHVFKLPIDTSTICQLRITYCQFCKKVLEVTEDGVTLDGQEVRYHLSQEDTLRFKPQGQVEVQIKVLTEDGNVMASKVMALPVDKVLNAEVLS